MSFLILVNGIVEVTDEGMTIPSVKELYTNDKNSEKKFFHDSITYIFFSYKNKGVYCNKLPSSRKQFVIDKHLSNRKVSDFENHPRVKAVIEDYIDCEFTPIERLGEGLKRDVESMLKRIETIPYEKQQKVEFDVDYTIPGSTDGEKGIKHISMMWTVDNSEEKEKKLQLALKLFDYEKALNAKMFDESKEKRRSTVAKLDKI